MITYKLLKDYTNEVYAVSKNGVVIPLDEANTDYQEYLKWVEAGNTPLPADNPPEETP